MSEIANKDFNISITQSGAMVPGGVIGVPPTVVESDLTIVEADAADAPSSVKIVVDKMTEPIVGMIMTLGCKSPGFAGGAGSDAPAVPPQPGAVTILAGSTKVTCSGKKAHLNGDAGVCTCAVLYTLPPAAPVMIPGVCTFEITDAGQDKAVGV